MASALGLSLDFLFGAQVEDIEFETHSGLSARDLATAKVVLIDAIERYLTIEDILGIPPTGNRLESWRLRANATLGSGLGGHAGTPSEIDRRANELRRAWNLGLGPLPGLCDFVEDSGIKVIEGDLPERFNGLAARVRRGGEGGAEAVLVSSRTSVEQLRFVLAHELARRMVRTDADSATEPKAAIHRFAVTFLVPYAHLRKEVDGANRRINRDEVMRLMHMYGVPAEVMLERLGQVGVAAAAVDQRTREAFASSRNQAEPEPIGKNHLLAASERPRRFKRLVWRAVRERAISPVRAAALLNESLYAVEQEIRRRGRAVSAG